MVSVRAVAGASDVLPVVRQAPQAQQPRAVSELSRAFARAQILATRAPSRVAHKDDHCAFLHAVHPSANS